MALAKVKPARPGLIVKDPDTFFPIPEAGAEVDVSQSYWQRRLIDKDIVIVTETPAEKPAETKKGGNPT